MGELVILEDWKKEKDQSELSELIALLDQHIELLELRQQFFIFDNDFNMSEIFPVKEN